MIYHPNELPPDYRALFEEDPAPAGGSEAAIPSFLTAADIALRVHRAVEKAGIQEPERVGPERVELTRQIRLQEQKQLRKWASSVGLIRPWDEFELPWRDQGAFAGGEHDVYYRDERVWKRHVAENALDFGTYFSYLTRIALHAVIFPETPYRLEGFTESPEGVLMTLLSQPEVRYDPERWVEPGEVDVLMARRGFRKAGATRYVSEDGILEVADVHTENVVLYDTGTDERVLAVVDGDINIIPPGWSSTHA